MNKLLITHAECSDGFTAAWVAHRALQGCADLHPGYYGTEPPDCSGRDVIIADFSYKRPAMEKIAAECASLVVLEHHVTARDELAGDWPSNVQIIFDLNRSGARLAWDYFYPDEPPPWLIAYVEDRDLWRWALPDSRLVSAGIESYPRTLESWDILAASAVVDVIAEGRIIQRYREICIDAAKRLAREFIVAGHWVPVANCSEMRFASDIAHELSDGRPFAATWWVRADGIIQFSLRSREDGADVSEIAGVYGGGGHRHAAGFQVDGASFAEMLKLSKEIGA